MTHDIELLRNRMGAASDDQGRARALIGHIKDKLDAAGTDPTALRELSTFLEVNLDELADRAVDPYSQPAEEEVKAATAEATADPETAKAALFEEKK